MKKIRIGFVVTILSFSLGSSAQTNLVADNIEFAVLKNIYDSLGGTSWTTKTNWPTTWPGNATSAQFGTWYGVTVTNGDISAITFNANNLQGTIPKTIGQLGSLVTLTITSNALLNSIIPSTIGNLTKLVTLNFTGNHLTGTVPSTIANMSAMQVFNVGQNALTGSFPMALCGLTGLHTLSLNNNLFTGSIPAAIGNMTGLSSMDLHAATFSGEIPSSMGNLTNMVILSLVSNQLTGPIPTTLAKLTKVKYFMLGGNLLTGQVPPELAALTKTISFSISENKLTGPIPPSFFTGWTQLADLNFLGNNFSGDFPTSISSCTALTSLHGEYNLFTSIPASINSLNLISYINFSHDELKTIPDLSLQANKSHLTLFLDNNRLDFSQLEPLMSAGFVSFATPTQKNISDVSQMSVKIGSDLVITPRSPGAHSTITWEKRQVNGTWSSVNASDADATLATYKRSPSVNTDLGIYHWKMTNSVVTGVTLQSDPIEVKDLYFVALDNLGFQYRYDSKNRMIQKKVPGADWVYMVYDPHDRPVLTQDGEQRKANQWAFTKYDMLNRPIMTGIRDTTVALTQSQMQTVVNAYYSKTSSRWFEVLNVGGANTVHNYTDKSYPVVANPDSYLTVTYYDNYDFNSGNPDFAYVSGELTSETRGDFTYAQESSNFDFLNGQHTGSKVRILETNGRWLRSVTYYDKKYRVIQTIGDDHRGGVERTTNLYDFGGQLLKTRTTYINEKTTWKDLVGAKADDHALTATSAIASWGSNGAASQATLAASTNGWAETTYVPANTSRAFGFSTSNADANYTSINYAILFGNSTQSATVYENGVSKYVLSGAPVSGDIFRVDRTGSTVTYRKNGVTFYTSSATTSAALLVDAALYNGGSLQNVRISFATPYVPASFTRTQDFDHMGRLLKIWHQTGAGDKVLLTMNQYNELGQLIDKKLHNTDPTSTADASRKFRQSIDYRYNIRGWLSSVNNSKLEVNSTNDDVNDLFGMNLLYDSVDAGIGNTPQYNGNISSMKWSRNAATGFVKDLAYSYAYDTLNRLKSANFLKDSVTWTNPDLTFNETNFAYDRNGNIRHLERTGRKGSSMDVLSYSYATTGTLSNKLMSVTDAGLSAQGFTDGNAGSDDYTYDTNGSMTADKNKGVSAITYNFLHLPDKVTKTDNAFIQYVYDATGQKRQQQVFDKNSVLTKKADYLGEMYFENDTLKFAHHDEGRIILTGATPEYQYDLKDHLGNVRMTFTSKAEVDSALATLETAKVSSEQAKFLYYDEAVKINAAIFDHTDAGGTYYSTRLNGSASERSGLAKSLSVMPGDTINAKVYAKYLDPDHGNWTGFDLATLIASYSNPAAGTFIDGGATGSTGGLTAPFLGQLDKGAETGTAPKAFLNYVVFDRDYHFVDGGFVRVTSDAREYGQDGPHQELSSQIVVTQPGYVYIYLSNDNVALGGSAVEVYFDDFEVNHIKSPVVQSQDYYPFGLAFNSYQRENSLLNKWKFQSQEHVDDLGLNWDSFKWRNHQPDIGRFFNVDPLAEKYDYNSPYAFSENKVVAHRELEGLESELAIFGLLESTSNANGGVAAATGFGVGVSQGITNTAGGLVNAVTHPIETAEGIASLGNPIGQVQAGMALVNDASQKVDQLQNGTTFEQAQVVGEVTEKVAELTVGTKGISGGTLASEAEGVVYLRTDKILGGLKPYVGQAKSASRYAARQAEHARKNPRSNFKFKEIDRGHPGKDLSLKEQKALDARGGPTNKSNPNGGTSNKKNVIKKKLEK